MVRPEPATVGLQTLCSSHRAIQLKSFCRKELSLPSWCIASLYIYHFSTVIDFSSEKYSGFTGHRNSWSGTSREIYSEDVDGETRTRNPWITNPEL